MHRQALLVIFLAQVVLQRLYLLLLHLLRRFHWEDHLPAASQHLDSTTSAGAAAHHYHFGCDHLVKDPAADQHYYFGCDHFTGRIDL